MSGEISPPVRQALEQAERDARRVPGEADGAVPRDQKITRHVAIGDPQAPIEKFLTILDEHGLLGDDGRLAADVHLVCMGDYFDWGDQADRARAAHSGLMLLSWLAAHPRSSATLIIGNHDLARVGELSHLDDEAFLSARDEADAAYRGGRPRRDEAGFRAATGLSSWEVAARDFSTFDTAQRALVAGMLRGGRFDIALAPSHDLLLTHAGVTTRELSYLGLCETDGADAERVAAALRRKFEEAVTVWRDGPLGLPGLHRPGDAMGEGGGMFYHRPEVSHAPRQPGGAAGLRRRYHVDELPRGLAQAIGHIRDAKCRTLLGVTADGEPEGGLHYTEVSARGATYARGAPPEVTADTATLLFLDGGMQHVPTTRYELYDLVRRAPLPPPGAAR